MRPKVAMQDVTARCYKARLGVLFGAALMITLWGVVVLVKIQTLEALAVLVPGAILLTCSVLRRSMISIDTHGIQARRLFSTTYAQWRDVGPLLPAEPGYNLAWRHSTEATMVDDNGRESVLSIPDNFSVPVDEILDQIDVLRHAKLQRQERDSSTGPDAPVPRPKAQIMPQVRPWPWVTCTLTVVFCTVYAAEMAVKDRGGIDGDAMIAMGGLAWPLVQAGQWYRVLTAPLLHATLISLFFSLVILWSAGRCLERRVGASWMFTIFSAGALASSAGSMLTLPEQMISGDPTTTFLAFLSALIVTGYGLPNRRGGINVQILASIILTMILSSTVLRAIFLYEQDGTYGPVIGSTIAGALLGLVIVRTWRQDKDAPGNIQEATIAAWVGAALMAISVCVAIEKFATGAAGGIASYYP